MKDISALKIHQLDKMPHNVVADI